MISTISTETRPSIDDFYDAVKVGIQTAIEPTTKAARPLTAIDHEKVTHSVTQALAAKEAKFLPAIAKQQVENQSQIHAIDGFFPSTTLSALLRGTRRLS